MSDFSPVFQCKKCSRYVDKNDGSIVRKICSECLERQNPYDKIREELDTRIDRLFYERNKDK